MAGSTPVPTFYGRPRGWCDSITYLGGAKVRSAWHPGAHALTAGYTYHTREVYH